MASNEQKLYVLLNSTPSMSESESEIWNIVHSHISPDVEWYKNVAKILTDSEYLKHGWAFDGKESREVWSTTDDGRKQIPKLWNGCELKKRHNEEVKTLKKESSFEERHKKLNKFLWIVLTAIISSVITALITNLVSQLYKK